MENGNYYYWCAGCDILFPLGNTHVTSGVSCPVCKERGCRPAVVVYPRLIEKWEQLVAGLRRAPVEEKEDETSVPLSL